ncbi:MAG: hypothetical protein RJQ09_01080 [Cyclobacteriaceae bacterium]
MKMTKRKDKRSDYDLACLRKLIDRLAEQKFNKPFSKISGIQKSQLYQYLVVKKKVLGHKTYYEYIATYEGRRVERQSIGKLDLISALVGYSGWLEFKELNCSSDNSQSTESDHKDLIDSEFIEIVKHLKRIKLNGLEAYKSSSILRIDDCHSVQNAIIQHLLRKNYKKVFRLCKELLEEFPYNPNLSTLQITALFNGQRPAHQSRPNIEYSIDILNSHVSKFNNFFLGIIKKDYFDRYALSVNLENWDENLNGLDEVNYYFREYLSLDITSLNL